MINGLTGTYDTGAGLFTRISETEKISGADIASPSPDDLTHSDRPLNASMGHVCVYGTYKRDGSGNLTINDGSKSYAILNLGAYSGSSLTNSTKYLVTGFAVFDGVDLFIDLFSAEKLPSSITVNAKAEPSDGGSATIIGNMPATPYTDITLNAAPNEGYDFAGWFDESGTQISDIANCTYRVKKAATLIAKFTKQQIVLPQITLTVTASQGGTATIINNQGNLLTVNESTDVTISADAQDGFIFAGWWSDNTFISDENPYTFNLQSSIAIEARFSSKPVDPTPEEPAKSLADLIAGGAAVGTSLLLSGPCQVLPVSMTPGLIYVTDGSRVLRLETAQTFAPGDILNDIPVTIRQSGSEIYATVTQTLTPAANSPVAVTYSDIPLASVFTSGNLYKCLNIEGVYILKDQSITDADTYLLQDGTVNTISKRLLIEASQDVLGENTPDNMSTTSKKRYNIKGVLHDYGTAGQSEFVLIAERVDLAGQDIAMVELAVSASEGGTAWIGETSTSTSAQFAPGTAVTIHAAPIDGWQFAGWYENKSEVSASADYKFTITADRSLQATFTKIDTPLKPEQPVEPATYPVKFTSPANGSITVVITSTSRPVASGDMLDEGTEIAITFTPSAGYKVNTLYINDVAVYHQSGTYTTTVSGPITIKGTLDSNISGVRQISVVSSNPAMGTVYINTPGQTSIQATAQQHVELHAEPEPDCVFSGWELSSNPGARIPGAVFVVPPTISDSHFTGIFDYIIQTPRTITVRSSNPAKGSVVIDGQSASAITTQRYVTVSATPASVYDNFVGWTDANGVEISKEPTFTYTGEADIDLTANFASAYPITYSSTGAGTILLSRQNSDSPIPSGELLPENVKIQITLLPEPHNIVESLTINGSDATQSLGDGNSLLLTTAAPLDIKAAFAPRHYSITIANPVHGTIEVYRAIDAQGSGCGTPLGSTDRAPYASDIYIFATPHPGYTLLGVTINGSATDPEQGAAYIHHSLETHVEIDAQFSATDGITGLSPDSAETIRGVYDLNGRYLGRTLPAAKGIYIVKTTARILKISR